MRINRDNILGRVKIIGLLLLVTASGKPLYAWEVAEQSLLNNDADARVAYTTNNEGYSLELYRDSVGAVRSRFTLTEGLLRFSDRHCPSYQIDRGITQNRSINDAPCISDSKWAEFVLGYIEDDVISSSTLLAIMNGITINFRFILDNGDYRATKFSLAGSKRAMLGALGNNIEITRSVR